MDKQPHGGVGDDDPNSTNPNTHAPLKGPSPEFVKWACSQEDGFISAGSQPLTHKIKMKFAISIVAMLQSPWENNKIRHIAIVFEANNFYEAIGKGHLAARLIYPPKDGWTNHDVTGQDASLVINDPKEIIAKEFNG